MLRKLILTDDGSHTIEIPELSVNYHSTHGAVQESNHIFIDAGLRYLNSTCRFGRNGELRIFEMGFGTGLNALLTLIEAESLEQKIYYEVVELFPLTADEAALLNYCDILSRKDLQSSFDLLHSCAWREDVRVSADFTFRKFNVSLIDYDTNNPIHLIFFDPFDPVAQPDLWTQEIFQKMFSILQKDGILVTYSSKGSVRRAMQAAGFEIEKIPGPPGKKEIVRAVKFRGLMSLNG